jgi:hypothetical protein
MWRASIQKHKLCVGTTKLQGFAFCRFGLILVGFSFVFPIPLVAWQERACLKTDAVANFQKETNYGLLCPFLSTS